jgi:uracil-DNA glycosylase family 4
MDGESESTASLPEPHAELSSLAAGLASHLRRRELCGPQRVARAAAQKAVPVAPPPERTVAAPPVERQARASLFGELAPIAPDGPAVLPDLPLARENRARAEACATLGELRAVVAECVACGLAKTRTQTVFSDGREHARVMFIGEAPGESEDLQGVPFVGAAGQLLTDIIEKGMGLARKDVYIANVLKCRPPGNRDPEPDEKALCTPYLDRQIELLNPEVILALGLHAARHLLRTPLSMGRLRGKVHIWKGRKVVATYHPAYLLRTPSAKKDCWQDIQLAMRELGLAPPGKPAR